jgi:hypothetical protein
MSDVRLRPYTAREALLAILAESEEVDDSLARANAEELARQGLDRTAPENFELTDQLADRLAEAHRVLLEIQGRYPTSRQDKPAVREFVDDKLKFSIDAALALPPDLEAMVERRIGHG